MKLGPDVPYTKIKKVRETTEEQPYLGLGGKKAHLGAPHRVKNQKFPNIDIYIYIYIYIYISLSLSIYIYIHIYIYIYIKYIFISIDYKFYVLSEKYKNHLLEINRKPPRGKVTSGTPRRGKTRFSKNGHIFYTFWKIKELYAQNQQKTPLGQNSFNWYLCIYHCIDAV